MSDYLSKPLMTDDLKDILIKWLSPGAQPQPAAVASRPSVAPEPVRTQPAPVPSAGPVEVFDADKILERMMGDEMLVQAVVRKFLETLDDRTSVLASALRARNRERIKFHAHSLAGAAANINAGELRSFASSLERLAVSNSALHEEENCSQLHDVVNRLKKAIKENPTYSDS